MKLWKLLDGWKTIIGYGSAHLFTNYPLIANAFVELLKNPTDKQGWVNFIVHLVLAYGVLDIVRKRLEEIAAKREIRVVDAPKSA